MINEQEWMSYTMFKITNGEINIDYMSVAEIIDRYGELLTEKELNQLKTHLDGD